MSSQDTVTRCQAIIDAYNLGRLGTYAQPESIAPEFSDQEDKLRYYTLPMSLNYRRKSDQLWAAARDSYLDGETRIIYDLAYASRSSLEETTNLLSVYKLAMQPTRHALTWKTIAETIYTNWGSVTNLLRAVDDDFLALKDAVQVINKKGFPYLAGPKIFNFWAFILSTRCDVRFTHKEHIEIAVDGHIRRSSVELGVIKPEEEQSLSAEQIAFIWREVLDGSNIAPVDLNIPLWYWSRNRFSVNSGD